MTDVRDAVVVVTGGASGIGLAIAEGAIRRRARAVVIADVDGERAAAAAASLGSEATSAAVDVADERAVRTFVDDIATRFGAIDLYCSNAGVPGVGGVDVDAATWERSWRVNAMSHVLAAQALLPGWRQRGRGHLVITASGAGLAMAPGQLPYTAAKHAAVGVALSLAVEVADDGIGVSCLCPGGVRTPMLEDADETTRRLFLDSAMSPEEVADATFVGVANKDLFIFPDASVSAGWRALAKDPNAWRERLRAVLGTGASR